MRALPPLLVACLAACLSCAPTPEGPPAALPLVDLVDPAIGTGGFGFAYGAVFLGAASPHGLMKVGPDTTGSFGEARFLHTSGNWDEDPTILCFSHVHLHGVGVPEGGVIALMPTTAFEPEKPRAVDYQATRTDERKSPGSYAVHLAEPDIDVELAATVHAAQERFTFPAGTVDAVIVLDLQRTLIEGEVTDAQLNVDGARITGSLHTVGSLSPPGGYDVFFTIEADTPFTSVDELVPDGGVGAALHFGPRDSSQPVELRVGISYVDVDGARANLAAELPPGADARALAHDAWSTILSRVRVFGGSEDDQVIFASSLYRSFLMPTVMSDVDGRWRGPDGAVRTAGFRVMTDFSLWDTYRTVHPLYALIAPDAARDAARSLIAFTSVLGYGPLWPMATGDASVMVGSPTEVVLADALARGVIEAAELEPIYELLRANALEGPEGLQERGGRSDVVAYDAQGGWVPAPFRGPVSKTLEYAVADQSLALIAAALGHDDDADRLLSRSHGWQELHDPAAGFLRGRNADGTFTIDIAEFTPEHFGEDYVEANAWQSLFPLDDMEGVVAVYGGVDGALAKLRDLFERSKADFAARDPDAETFGLGPLPFHWQGNEPSLHVPALAYQLGDDRLAAEFVSWAMSTQYQRAPDGLPGNDDGGALSSWYALAALGLFPVPGSADWVIGAPLFHRAEVDVDGATLTITSTGASSARVQHSELATALR
ncbi:MAG: GH92 family glycosyl hydrolase [Deltaproteobacteria bacterium]|nr:GH92 family glycosyl hydrolase [Deltaproteobacteria bacterium]